MSFFGSIGNFIKNPIQPITHAIGNAVGVNANTNNGVHLKTPDPIGAIKSLATNPLVDVGLATLIPGLGSAVTGALGAIPGVGGALSSGAGAIGGLLSHIPGAAGGLGGLLGGLGNLGGDAAGFLTGNNGLNALGVAQAANGAQLQKKGSDLADQALATTKSAYDEKAPLRATGLQGLLHPATPDLSKLATIQGQLPGAPGPTGNSLAQPSSLASLIQPRTPTMPTPLPMTMGADSLAARRSLGGIQAPTPPQTNAPQSLSALQQIAARIPKRGPMAPPNPTPLPASVTQLAGLGGAGSGFGAGMPSQPGRMY